MKMRFVVAVAALLLAGAVAQAQPARELRGATLKIPFTEKTWFGASRELSLEATLFGGERVGAPLLIFNHGSTGRGRGSPTETLTYPRGSSSSGGWTANACDQRIHYHEPTLAAAR